MRSNELKQGLRNKISSHRFQQNACYFQLLWFIVPHRREEKNIFQTPYLLQGHRVNRMTHRNG